MQFDLFDETANAVLGTPTYAAFRERLLASNCQRCPLGGTRTNIVVDRGNPDRPILVIGEGPGENEDLQGKAFVGRAGVLLDKILGAIGLDTNRDMLIANVVKCRVPENLPPSAESVEQCLPYLRKQIELVRPRIVLLLGSTALKHLDPTRRLGPMSEEAGRFFTLGTYPLVEFMVLYHPAALLYNARLKSDMWAHVKILQRRLREMDLLPGSA
ncbi:MAG: uracil-DNA glycosylase [Planctomycetes bacterium]|nr:uracil-DNA glycosylase [Planctomycetota bacterium]